MYCTLKSSLNDFYTQNPSKNILLKAYANIYSKVVVAVNLVKSASDVKYASSDYYQCTTEPSLYTSHSSLYLDDFIDFYAFRGGATKWSYGCGNKGGVGLYDYTKVGDYLYWNSNIDIQSPVDLTSDIIVRKVIAITDLPYRRWEGGLWVRRMHLDSSIGAVAQGQYVYLNQAYGPIWGYLYGWSAISVINTASIAAVGVAFSEYLGFFFPLSSIGIKCVAVASIILLTTINIVDVVNVANVILGQ